MPRRMSRRRKILIGVVVVGLCLVALLLVIGPGLIEQAVTARVQAAASQRGLDVTWQAMQLDTAGATLEDVRVARPGASVRAPALRVEVAPLSVLRGEPRITALRVVAPEVHLEAAGLRGALDDIFADETADATDAIADGSADDTADLPAVTVSTLTLTARWPGGRVDAEAAELAFEPDGEGWTLRGQARITAEGIGAVTGAVNGRLAPGHGRVEIAGAEGPAVQLRRGESWLSAARVEAMVRHGTPSVELVEVNARHGWVALDDGVVDVRRDALRWAVALRGGALRVGEGEAFSAVDLPWVGLLTDRPAVSAPVDGGEAGGGVDPWVLAERVVFAADGLTVELPGLPRLREVGGRWDGGRLDARAVVAGGEVTVAVDATPGRRRPDGIHVHAEGIGLAPFFARRLPPMPPRRARQLGRVDGTVDGWLSVVGLDGPPGLGPTRVDGELQWRGGRVELAGVAPGPVDGIELTVGGGLEWDPGDDRIEYVGRAALGAFAVTGRGDVVDAGGDPVVRLRAEGVPVDCADAFASIPAGLLGPYARAEVSGRLAPTLRLLWPVHRPAALELQIRRLFKACSVDALNATAEGHPPATVDGAPAPSLDDVGWLDSRFALRVREGTSEGAEVAVGPAAPGFVPLATLPAYVGAAMYQSEEMGFWRNNAIDKGLLARALRIDLEAGRFVYGGSTVTQQLVKNLFLTRSKTLARKLQELLVATRITQVISRHRVLELYLNCIEFGPDVYGIGPASRYYFQKPAAALTPREAVFLAMLKPAPKRGAWYRKRGHTPTNPWWVERAETLMQRLVEGGQISAARAAAERPYRLDWVDRKYVGHPGRPPLEAEPDDESADDAPGDGGEAMGP